jgi:uncharacterized integral membrane protein
MQAGPVAAALVRHTDAAGIIVTKIRRYWSLAYCTKVQCRRDDGPPLARSPWRELLNMKGVVMVFTVVVVLVAVVVAVGVLQNGQTVTVSFFFWQVEAPLALIIVAATGAGLAIGGMVGWARALTRWRHRAAEPTQHADGVGVSPRPVRRGTR